MTQPVSQEKLLLHVATTEYFLLFTVQHSSDSPYKTRSKKKTTRSKSEHESLRIQIHIKVGSLLTLSILIL